jgi:hypothetical protein
VIDFYTRHTGDWESHRYYIKAAIDGSSCVSDRGDEIEMVDPLSADVSDAELWKVATIFADRQAALRHLLASLCSTLAINFKSLHHMFTCLLIIFFEYLIYPNVKISNQ